MGKIYILEGPDGTGKSTLAKALQKKTKGHLLHLTYNPDWDMDRYYEAMSIAIRQLSYFQDVIVDRWAVSEIIYGGVYRGGTAVNTQQLIDRFKDESVWIYCWNENAVKNHLKNKKERKEMYEDMTDVVNMFEGYMLTSDLPWKKYNYNHMNKDEFVREILND